MNGIEGTNQCIAYASLYREEPNSCRADSAPDSNSSPVAYTPIIASSRCRAPAVTPPGPGAGRSSPGRVRFGW